MLVLGATIWFAPFIDGFVPNGASSLSIPAANFIESMFEELRTEYPNYLILGWGHTHIEASLLGRMNKLVGNVHSSKYKDWFKNEIEIELDLAYPSVPNDFVPLIPNLQNPEQWGGNFCILISETGYTFYQTKLSSEPDDYWSPDLPKHYDFFDFNGYVKKLDKRSVSK